MGNVYSIKTKKKITEQDTKANDEIANVKGRYIGRLPNTDAEQLRKFQDKLICEQAQINELVEEFNEHYKDYLQDVYLVLMYLGIDTETFDTTKEKLFVGEDGHMWVVPLE